MESRIHVEDNGKKGRFVLEVDGRFAGEMTFNWFGPKKMIIDHTGIESDYEGQGLAKKLFEFAMDYGKKEELKIMPLCPFVKKMMDRDQDLNAIRF